MRVLRESRRQAHAPAPGATSDLPPKRETRTSVLLAGVRSREFCGAPAMVDADPVRNKAKDDKRS